MSNCVKQTLENFRFSTLHNNTITGILPARVLTSGVETKLATITIPADCDDFVWLSATVGWFSAPATAAPATTLTFNIYRDNELTPIFITQDTMGAGFAATTSFSHVDFNFPRTSDCVTYILTVTANATGATITGPITFIAATIENKHHEEKPHEEKPHCEPCCKPQCEPQCKPHYEPQCKPYCKPYGQKFDFD